MVQDGRIHVQASKQDVILQSSMHAVLLRETHEAFESVVPTAQAQALMGLGRTGPAAVALQRLIPSNNYSLLLMWPIFLTGLAATEQNAIMSRHPVMQAGTARPSAAERRRSSRQEWRAAASPAFQP